MVVDAWSWRALVGYTCRSLTTSCSICKYSEARATGLQGPREARGPTGQHCGTG